MRTLKQTGTSEAELKSAIHELLRRKQELLERERKANTNVGILQQECVVMPIGRFTPYTKKN